MNKNDKAATKNNILDKKIEMKNNRESLARKQKEEISNMQEIEDVTKYGEFISSYFSWLTIEKQKQNTEYMENIGEKNIE